MDTAPLGETYTGFEIEQPFSFQEELTLYDDMPTEQKPNVAELQKQMNLPRAYVNSPMPSKEATTLTVMPCSVSTVSHDIEMDEARKEVDNVCLQLGIPAGRFKTLFVYRMSQRALAALCVVAGRHLSRLKTIREMWSSESHLLVCPSTSQTTTYGLTNKAMNS